jgi:hypothetical protein
MVADLPDLKVRVCQCGQRYAWKLYFFEDAKAVRFSVPLYESEEKAKTAGEEARRMIALKRDNKRSRRSRS